MIQRVDIEKEFVSPLNYQNVGQSLGQIILKIIQIVHDIFENLV